MVDTNQIADSKWIVDSNWAVVHPVHHVDQPAQLVYSS